MLLEALERKKEFKLLNTRCHILNIRMLQTPIDLILVRGIQNLSDLHL